MKLLLAFLSALCTSVSPLKMGILEAETGEQRYEILYEAHKKALERGVKVDYSGIDTLRLTISKSAKSIPLGDFTDFHGTVFIVHNENKGNFYLFSLVKQSESVEIEDKSLFDKGDFRKIASLRNGKKMLIIEDQNPWIDNRRGFSYGMNRRDILLLDNGNAVNSTCATYNNVFSKPNCKYITIERKKVVFSNIEFYRTPNSTSKTFIVLFENQYNVNVSNIKLYTPPESGLYGDVAISFCNCAKVNVDYVVINGTYSMINNYGYGISMDNVYDSDFNHIEGTAPWGVFGNNYVNKTTLRNSHVNRFDVHCYGRDITMENCLFDVYGFLYSSIFGTVIFRKCTFINVFPCLNRLDFNAYTPFNLIFERCSFEFDDKHYALVNLSNIDDIINPRPELSEKCLPNIDIENCIFHLLPEVKYLYMFYVGGCKYPYPIKGLSELRVNGVVFTGSAVPLEIVNTYVNTEKEVNVYLNNISYRSQRNKISDYPFLLIKTLNNKEVKQEKGTRDRIH